MKNKKIKRSIWKLGMSLCLSILFLTLRPFPGKAANNVLSPHILTSGLDEDLAASAHYKFDSDGKQLITLQIPKDGALQMDIFVQTPALVNIELYRNADGSGVPVYLPCTCTPDRGGRGTVRQYLEKGTYYLCFPRNSYQANLTLYVTENQTLKNGTSAVSYCSHMAYSNFSYRAEDTGYVKLTQKRLVYNGENYCVSFYNEKGTKLTDIISDHDMDRDIYFPVRKGHSYRIKISALDTTGEQYYNLSLSFNVRTDKGSTRKDKASSINLGTTVSGMVFAESALSSARWYKLSNTKNRKMSITYSGYAASGNINISFLTSRGKCLKTVQIGQLSDNKPVKERIRSTAIPRGTYYIKVTKSQKTTAGIYSVRLDK